MISSKKCASLWAIMLLVQGCVSHPKMSADAPLEMRRGNWVDSARFYQRGRQVDRGDAKANLKRVDESSSDTKTAQVLEVCSTLAALGSGVLIGSGIVQAADKQPSWVYFASGGAALGLSITFAVTADGKYESAVNHFNRQLGPSSSPLAGE